MRPPESNRQLDVSQLDLFDARRAPRELSVSAAGRLADALSELLTERVRLTVPEKLKILSKGFVKRLA